MQRSVVIYWKVVVFAFWAYDIVPSKHLLLILKLQALRTGTLVNAIINTFPYDSPTRREV